jgi:hypothetical protein
MTHREGDVNATAMTTRPASASAPGAGGPALSAGVPRAGEPGQPPGMARTVRPSPAAAVPSPPFALPGIHFAAGAVFLSLGAAALVPVAPDLALGLHLTPRAAATTHLFTLGWITTSIMAALYQFIPVALGVGVRSARVGYATFLLYVPGLLAFVAGLYFGWRGALIGGAVVMSAGLLLFAGSLAGALMRSRQRDVTWWALMWADVYLVVTVLLGMALTGNLRWGYLGGGRLDALGTHLHIALGGWVLLVMIGVGHRLLPMFLLSHGAGSRAGRAAVALAATGAGMLTLLHHAPALLSRWLPALLLAGALVCFLAQARQFYVHRHRRILDPGMRLAAGALVLLGTALLLAFPVLHGAAPRIATAYVLALILGVTLFVAAHYYKIVPFLVWFHRFGPLAGTRALPRVAELYDARVATAAGVLLFAGAAALVAAVAAGRPGAAEIAAGVFAAGVAIEVSQMLLLAVRKP